MTIIEMLLVIGTALITLIITKLLEKNNKQKTAQKLELANKLNQLHDTTKKLDSLTNSLNNQMIEHKAAFTQQTKHITDEVRIATNLFNKPQYRGRWGETILEKILEISGIENINYELQYDFPNKNGIKTDRKVADAVVFMPKNRALIIDSKVTIPEPDANEDKNIDSYGRNIENHIETLSKKEYWKLLDNSPEYVVMFTQEQALVPATKYFKKNKSKAKNRDKYEDLLDWAFQEMKIIIVTPYILLALLKAIHYTWTHVKIEENAHQILNIGKELYANTYNFISLYQSIGKHLQKATDDYNKANKEWNENCMPTMEELHEFDLSSTAKNKTPQPIPNTKSSIVTNNTKKPNPPTNDEVNCKT